jgi:hypothetical protein
MKRILFLCILLFMAEASFSQELLPVIDGSLRVPIDTSMLKKGIEKMKACPPKSIEKEIRNFSPAYLQDMIEMNYLEIYVDTIQNTIKCRVDTTSFLVYVPQRKDKMFFWKTTSKYFTPVNNYDTKLFASALYKHHRVGYDPAFHVSLLPNQFPKFSILGFRIKNGQYAFLEVGSSKLFPSHKCLLDYYFGSLESYIESYRNRLRYKNEAPKYAKQIYQ